MTSSDCKTCLTDNLPAGLARELEVLAGEEDLCICRCRSMDYSLCLEIQLELVKNIIAGRCCNTIIAAEHKPVITLGVRKAENRLLCDRIELKAKGIDTIQLNRGGAATAHEPGQLVVYPVIALKSLSIDVNEYIRRLEQTGIELLSKLGVKGRRIKGRPGLWIDEKRKIASVGVKLKRWVSCHGIAVNINNNLETFKWIVPCGLEGITMTSVLKETGIIADMDEVRKSLVRICMEMFSSKGTAK